MAFFDIYRVKACVLRSAQRFGRYAPVKPHLARFGRADGGNFAMIFGIVLIPVLGFIGLGVDYNYLWKTRGQLQYATDVAAMDVARETLGMYTPKGGQRPANLIARASLEAHFKGKIEPDAIQVTMEPGVFIVRARHEVKPFVLGLFGYDTMNVETESHVSSGGGAHPIEKLTKLRERNKKQNAEKPTKADRDNVAEREAARNGCMVGATLRASPEMNASDEKELRKALRAAKLRSNDQTNFARFAREVERGFNSGNVDDCLSGSAREFSRSLGSGSGNGTIFK